MNLGKIAEIKTGLVVTRKKAEMKGQIEHRYKMVTLKNIEDDGVFNDQPLESFESIEKLSPNYFTAKDDILVRLSYPYTSVYVNELRTGLLVPSSFAVIKLKSEDYIPKYVAWYLNSDKIKREHRRYRDGTVMRITNKKILASFKIRTIPLKQQKAIVKLNELCMKERELLKRLTEEKERFYKVVINKVLQNEGEDL